MSLETEVFGVALRMDFSSVLTVANNAVASVYAVPADSMHHQW